MRYSDFEDVMSVPRMSRYMASTGNNGRKAMTLYRKNLQLSQEMFTVISCFEVALRNKINEHYTVKFGNDWLADSINAGGFFNIPACSGTARIIKKSKSKLTHYTHPKLIASLDFGFWRYLFAQPQYLAGGQSLLLIFPSKPKTTPQIQYNHTYLFRQLEAINEFRNRIAHHEPICFSLGSSTIDTSFCLQNYNLILQLFQWMNINEGALLYGLDHVMSICKEIDSLL